MFVVYFPVLQLALKHDCTGDDFQLVRGFFKLKRSEEGVKPEAFDGLKMADSSEFVGISLSILFLREKGVPNLASKLRTSELIFSSIRFGEKEILVNLRNHFSVFNQYFYPSKRVVL